MVSQSKQSRTQPKKTSLPRGTARYLELVRACPLAPIRTDAELDRAIAMLDSLSDKGKLAKVERDYMLVLADQVEKYEQKRYPMGDVSDVEMLRYLIETHGTTQAEVARGSGVNATTLSSILAGRRKMAREHVEALCRHFHVGPAVFLTDLCSSKS